MTRSSRALVVAALVVAAVNVARAQDSSSIRVTLDDRGLTFAAPARATEATIRLYVQPMAFFQGDDDAGALRRVTLQVRRARLGFSGTTFDPRLRFNIQLAFGRPEIETESVGGTSNVNILSDANVVWHWTPKLWTMFGQGKIFGNRQGINAAGELQFTERTILHLTFGPDRDVGVMGGYTDTLGRGPFTVRGSVTGGDGRNAAAGTTGLAYNARVDWQPLGAFKGNGAFSQGDLQREPNARFAIGAAYLYNVRAERLGGQTGSALFSPRDIRTTYVDATWKRRGVAVEVEYALRTSHDPVTELGTAQRAVYAGQGITGEVSYAMRNGFMPAVRVSSIVPDESIYGAPTALRRTQSALGLGRYLRGHRMKWQIEIGRDEAREPLLGTKTTQLYSRWSVLAGL